MVVVYGTVCRDRLHQVDHLPGPGGYVDITAETECIGGEAANTVLALQEWGVESRLCGNSLGTADLTRLAEESGLETGLLPTASHFEPVCDIYVTPDGQRTMFGRGFLEMKEWGDPSRIPLAKGSWLTADSNHGATALWAVETAKAFGMPVYLLDFVKDDTPPCQVWQSSTDWIGGSGSHDRNREWLEAWVDLHGCFGILTDGHLGFWAGGVWTDGKCRPVRHYPVLPCEAMVDSTGAGDVFRAGVLLGLTEGRPLASTLLFASAAGNLNCRALGANAGIPTRAEVERLIGRYPEVAASYE